MTDPKSIVGELRRQSSLKGRHGIESAKQKHRQFIEQLEGRKGNIT